MKDYKKILEGVVDIINVTEKSDIGFANICTYIGENCPEFKESEDERIRKSLIDYFKNRKDDGDIDETWYGISYDEILAWFEKQGNKDEEMLVLKDQIESLHAAIKALKETHRIKLEKQGEHQKFIDAIQVGDKVTRNKDGVLINLSQLNRVANKQGEQKPDTDFSDIRTWKYIVDAVLTGWNGIGQYLDNSRIETVAKELQERFGKIEQKPIAWSEEDEHGFENCLYAIKETFKGVDNPHRVGTINFLKSLKDRYTWKPSNKQMKAIEHICDGNYNVDLDILDSIYRDFKKLKG